MTTTATDKITKGQKNLGAFSEAMELLSLGICDPALIADGGFLYGRSLPLPIPSIKKTGLVAKVNAVRSITGINAITTSEADI
jgi:hypothetical protein